MVFPENDPLKNNWVLTSVRSVSDQIEETKLLLDNKWSKAAHKKHCCSHKKRFVSCVRDVINFYHNDFSTCSSTGSHSPGLLCSSVVECVK